jgi:hypothetical protein
MSFQSFLLQKKNQLIILKQLLKLFGILAR